MKKVVILLCFLHACMSAVNAQIVLQIDAGSRAPYGNTQSLLIDRNGQCTYKRTDVGGPVTESKTFSFTPAQLATIFEKADEVKFFELNEKYDRGYRDGAGIFIAMNKNGRKHRVDLRNTDVAAVNKFISFLNKLLEPQQIRIYYGQKP